MNGGIRNAESGDPSDRSAWLPLLSSLCGRSMDVSMASLSLSRSSGCDSCESIPMIRLDASLEMFPWCEAMWVAVFVSDA